MKFDFFKFIIFALLGALIAWGFYSLCREESVKVAMAIVVAVVYIIASVCFSLKLEDSSRSQVNIRVAVACSLVLLTIVDLIFCFVASSFVPLIIINGVSVLLMMLIVRSIAKAAQ